MANRVFSAALGLGTHTHRQANTQINKQILKRKRSQASSYICDPAPVPGHCLRFQCCLLHPFPKGLELILRVQDEEAGVFGGSLEEGYIWAQPPVGMERMLSLRVAALGILTSG